MGKRWKENPWYWNINEMWMTGDAGGELRGCGRWYMAGEEWQQSVETSCLCCWGFSLSGNRKKKRLLIFTNTYYSCFIQFQLLSQAFLLMVSSLHYYSWLQLNIITTNEIPFCKRLYRSSVLKTINIAELYLKTMKPWYLSQQCLKTLFLIFHVESSWAAFGPLTKNLDIQITADLALCFTASS